MIWLRLLHALLWAVVVALAFWFMVTGLLDYTTKHLH